jgi:hypothetical protein
MSWGCTKHEIDPAHGVKRETSILINRTRTREPRYQDLAGTACLQVGRRVVEWFRATRLEVRPGDSDHKIPVGIPPS